MYILTYLQSYHMIHKQPDLLPRRCVPDLGHGAPCPQRHGIGHPQPQGFDRATTLAILAGFSRNRRVMVTGFHGTGKSTHIEQVAARLNWPCVLDGRNLYEPALMREFGIDYVGVGRAAAVSDAG